MKMIKSLPFYLRKLLSDKTQVIPNTNINNYYLKSIQEQTIHTRASHSEQVMEISLELLNKLPQYKFLSEEDQEKYNQYLYYTSMLHDIGQPSYGHALANLTNEIIQEHFDNLYFDDNSNNIVFLEMYNLKRTLKTLNINYSSNIAAINKIIYEKNEDMYYKRLLNLVTYKPLKNISTKDIIFFKNALKEENEGLLLDKNLLCYLIKYPYCLDKQKNIKKGLYPLVHAKYISHFFKLKIEEQKNGLEINKRQLMCTWLMDMSDEIAYMNGDVSNFLNLYHNNQPFAHGIQEFYPNIEKELYKLKQMILNNCPFPFKRKIDSNSDFNVIENKLIKYFLNNIKIDEKIKTNNIHDLFLNKDAKKLFDQIKIINYKIYIPFTEKNFNLKFNNKSESVFKTKEFLNKIYKQIKKENKLPHYIIENIQSDLYKELIIYHLKEGNKNQVAMFYTNYLMELSINKFNDTIDVFFQRNPIKNKKTLEEIKQDNKNTKNELKIS